MRRISTTAFRIARRGTSREINRQIALNLVRARQPISRAELARLMGVRRGAVSRLVDELLETGLVFEGSKGESRRGRKPTQLYLETRRRCVAAVDVSASQTAVLVTDVLGHPLVDVTQFPTRHELQPLVDDLARTIGRVLADHPEVGACIGIGVSVSGLVVGGRLRFSPTLGWRDVDLRAPLMAATKLPVVVENSCKACVLAQVWAVRGDVSVEGPVAFVNVSDGIGVGVAVDGKLLRGASNVAGEFGHVPLNMYGPRCSCGQRGCWEAYASKRATIARYRGTDLSWPECLEAGSVTIEEIMARARAGEERALQALRETGYYLGRGFATIVKTIDPRRIYVGGEITEVWDLVAETVKDALDEDAVVREAGGTEILTVALKEHPRLRGAAALIHAPAFAATVVS
jgi:predicted NBD/HSP70 family sugar kinase/biotin operon repressor